MSRPWRPAPVGFVRKANRSRSSLTPRRDPSHRGPTARHAAFGSGKDDSSRARSVSCGAGLSRLRKDRPPGQRGSAVGGAGMSPTCSRRHRAAGPGRDDKGGTDAGDSFTQLDAGGVLDLGARDRRRSRGDDRAAAFRTLSMRSFLRDCGLVGRGRRRLAGPSETPSHLRPPEEEEPPAKDRASDRSVASDTGGLVWTGAGMGEVDGPRQRAPQG